LKILESSRRCGKKNKICFLPQKLIFNQFLTEKPRNTLGTLLNQFMPLKKHKKRHKTRNKKSSRAHICFLNLLRLKKETLNLNTPYHMESFGGQNLPQRQFFFSKLEYDNLLSLIHSK